MSVMNSTDNRSSAKMAGAMRNCLSEDSKESEWNRQEKEWERGEEDGLLCSWLMWREISRHHKQAWDLGCEG